MEQEAGGWAQPRPAARLAGQGGQFTSGTVLPALQHNTWARPAPLFWGRPGHPCLGSA